MKLDTRSVIDELNHILKLSFVAITIDRSQIFLLEKIFHSDIWGEIRYGLKIHFTI